MYVNKAPSDATLTPPTLPSRLLGFCRKPLCGCDSKNRSGEERPGLRRTEKPAWIQWGSGGAPQVLCVQAAYSRINVPVK